MDPLRTHACLEVDMLHDLNNFLINRGSKDHPMLLLALFKENDLVHL
jgi:hypothetical protein